MEILSLFSKLFDIKAHKTSLLLLLMLVTSVNLYAKSSILIRATSTALIYLTVIVFMIVILVIDEVHILIRYTYKLLKQNSYWLSTHHHLL